MRWPLVTIACMLALAYLMNYSGATATLGLSLAHTGASFPFFSAMLGWIAVFLTGSDTAANALFGNAASVLVGDFLYSRSFQMMVGVGKMRVMEILSAATTIISEGEVLQLLNMHDADVDTDRYMQVIRYKTAKLFEAAAQLGAVLSGADARTEEAAAEYGRR